MKAVQLVEAGRREIVDAEIPGIGNRDVLPVNPQIL